MEEDCGGFKIHCTQNVRIMFSFQMIKESVETFSVSVEQVSENPVGVYCIKFYIKIFIIRQKDITWRKDPFEVGVLFEESQPICYCGPPALSKGMQRLWFIWANNGKNNGGKKRKEEHLTCISILHADNFVFLAVLYFS